MQRVFTRARAQVHVCKDKLETANQMRSRWEKAAMDGKLENSKLQEEVLCMLLCAHSLACVRVCAGVLTG